MLAAASQVSSHIPGTESCGGAAQAHPSTTHPESSPCSEQRVAHILASGFLQATHPKALGEKCPFLVSLRDRKCKAERRLRGRRTPGGRRREDNSHKSPSRRRGGMGWQRGFAWARRLCFLGQEFNARLRFK